MQFEIFCLHVWSVDFEGLVELKDEERRLVGEEVSKGDYLVRATGFFDELCLFVSLL